MGSLQNLLWAIWGEPGVLVITTFANLKLPLTLFQQSVGTNREESSVRSSGHSGNTDVTSCRGPEWNQQPYKTGSIRVPLTFWSIDSWSQVDVKVYSSKAVCKIYESSSQCFLFHVLSSVSVSFTRRRRGKKSEKVLRLLGEKAVHYCLVPLCHCFCGNLGTLTSSRGTIGEKHVW